MDETNPTELIFNNIGSPLEQTVKHTVMYHRKLAATFLDKMIEFGLRNSDRVTADNYHYSFSYAAAVELEDNRNAYACANCLAGNCSRVAHNSDD